MLNFFPPYLNTLWGKAPGLRQASAAEGDESARDSCKIAHTYL